VLAQLGAAAVHE